MHRRQVSCFLIADHDRKIFNVIESANGHGWPQDRIGEQQAKGRDVRGYPSTKPASEVREDYQKSFGYEYSKDTVL